MSCGMCRVRTDEIFWTLGKALAPTLLKRLFETYKPIRNGARGSMARGADNATTSTPPGGRWNACQERVPRLNQTHSAQVRVGPAETRGNFPNELRVLRRLHGGTLLVLNPRLWRNSCTCFHGW